jgi:regulator of replication initiation timing
MFLGSFYACKQQSGNNGVPILAQGVGMQSSSDVDRLLSESRSELSRMNQEAQANKDQISSLERKINDISTQLKASQDLSAEQKRTLEAELAALKKQRDDLDAQLKALADKQAATQKQLDDAKKQASNSSTLGSSGFPFCGNLFYGIEFDCNGRKCGKSDPAYQNTCEITPTSQAAMGNAAQNGSSGYPLCGALYYGIEFDCNGKKCGKSDSEYKNICEITATSKAATTGSSNTTLGVSGYPYCPTPRYGIDFDCTNGRRCAKSDPEYKNICEIK